MGILIKNPRASHPLSSRGSELGQSFPGQLQGETAVVLPRTTAARSDPNAPNAAPKQPNTRVAEMDLPTIPAITAESKQSESTGEQ